MASRDIALMGGDTSANDAQPSGEKGDGASLMYGEMQVSAVNSLTGNAAADAQTSSILVGSCLNFDFMD